MKYYYKRIIWISSLFLLFIFILDSFIMPVYVHNKSIVQVPNVVGIKYEEAELYLKKEGFSVFKINGGSHQTIPFGFVNSQNPIAFRNVKEGRDIYLTVVTAKKNVLLPKLIGKTLRDATFSLESIGLIIGEISYKLNSSFPKEVITTQSSSPGTTMQPNTIINVTINSNPPIESQTEVEIE